MKILVIGESCMDVFLYCDATRLAPDIPVPVLEIENTVSNPGMSRNVYTNMWSLLYSHPGEVLVSHITNDDWRTIKKRRYVHEKSNHTFFRVDDPHNIGRYPLSRFISGINDYDAVVISDYNKGFLLEQDIAAICSAHDLVFLDTKKVLGPWAKDATFIKINEYEYTNSLPYIDDVLRPKIIHTLGDRGCSYHGTQYSVTPVEVKDSSGAGDTFMAALVVEYMKSDDIIQSIKFANECASTIVTQRGVVTI